MRMMMIEYHHHRSNLRIKKLHDGYGQGSWIKGVRGQTLKKGGVRGGSQKSPNFAHGGGKSGGGFFGGVPKNRGHKTWRFCEALNLKFKSIVEDNHHR